MRRSVVAVMGVALVVAAMAGPAPAAPSSDTRQARVVGVGGPSTMILRPGCRQTYKASAVFDAVAGEDYLAVINAEDGTGRTIDGAVRDGTVTRTGRVTVSAPLLLCGSVHDPGKGVIKVGLLVGGTDVNLRKTVRLKFADRVSMRKPAKRVRKGTKVRLRGTWSRGAGYPRGLTTYVRKAVRVRILFRPAGKKARYVRSVPIDAQGRWSTRVKVTKRGTWQARITASDRLLPAKSKRHTIRVRR